MTHERRYPLDWPLDVPRTPGHRRKAGPYTVSRYQALGELKAELRRFKARNVIVSTNVRVKADGDYYANDRPMDGDPGVVLYCTINGKDLCFPCDRFTTVAANVRAIWQVIAALRTIKRVGVEHLTDRAFSGYNALPASTLAQRSWWVVFGWEQPHGPFELVKERYRKLALERHPDGGGTAEQMAELNAAYEDAQRWLKGQRW